MAKDDTYLDEPYKQELLTIIQERIDRHDRSHQVEIGPSEVGGCPRKVVWKLAYGGDGDRPGGWAAHKGTVMHEDLDVNVFGMVYVERQPETAERIAELVDAYVEKVPGPRFMPDGSQRFYSNLKLPKISPHINGGTLDLYDKLYQRVVDFKDLSLDTVIPIPSGWTTVGEIGIGDELFGADGGVCRVTAKTKVFIGDDTFRVTMDEGSEFLAGRGHLWNVVVDGTTKARPYVATTMTTGEIAARLERPGKQRDCRIINADFLNLPESDLPVDPYVLGAWLGDGESDTGRIGSGVQDAAEMSFLLDAEPGIPRSDGFVRFRLPGLTTALRDLGVLGDKHIPERYLRASYDQRLALLQGLMDTDGTWNSGRKAAVFSQKSYALTEQVAELVHTLGWKAKIHEVKHSGFGVEGTYYDVSFVPFRDAPFRLKRKADKVRPNGSAGSHYRIVQSVERVPTVPMQCITVDSPDSCFLVGPGMVPTHNCPGDGTMDKARAGTLGRGYLIQGDIYGEGAKAFGLPVQTVALLFLPQCGDNLHGKAVMRVWKQDSERAWEYIRAVERWKNMLEVASPRKVLELAPTLSDFCQSCPAFTGNGDRRAMCPGASPGNRSVNSDKNPFSR